MMRSIGLRRQSRKAAVLPPWPGTGLLTDQTDRVPMVYLIGPPDPNGHHLNIPFQYAGGPKPFQHQATRRLTGEQIGHFLIYKPVTHLCPVSVLQFGRLIWSKLLGSRAYHFREHYCNTHVHVPTQFVLLRARARTCVHTSPGRHVTSSAAGTAAGRRRARPYAGHAGGHQRLDPRRARVVARAAVSTRLCKAACLNIKPSVPTQVGVLRRHTCEHTQVRLVNSRI
jgi:hypothetical protein